MPERKQRWNQWLNPGRRSLPEAIIANAKVEIRPNPNEAINTSQIR
jgi:hypothetical protein